MEAPSDNLDLLASELRLSWMQEIVSQGQQLEEQVQLMFPPDLPWGSQRLDAQQLQALSIDLDRQDMAAERWQHLRTAHTEFIGTLREMMLTLMPLLDQPERVSQWTEPALAAMNAKQRNAVQRQHKAVLDARRRNQPGLAQQAGDRSLELLDQLRRNFAEFSECEWAFAQLRRWPAPHRRLPRRS